MLYFAIFCLFRRSFLIEIEQLGIQQNHNIAFYGGGEASRYRVSLGYLDREVWGTERNVY